MDTLKTKQEFDFVYKNGFKRYCKDFIIYMCKDKALDSGFRVGLSVSKKVGNAVQRNLIKRRLKALLQSIKAYSGFCVIIVAKQSIISLSFKELQKSLLEGLYFALQKIGIHQCSYKYIKSL